MTQIQDRQGAVDLALARHREQLLDLSARNPLLHFVTRDAKGKLKPKRLELQTPALDEMYRLLVTEGHGVTFEGSRDAVPEDDEDFPGFSRLGAGGGRKNDLKVQVPLTAPDLQKRLIQTFRTSREFMEEQGVNCLYLGLGQLRWFEDRKSASDPLAPRLAPLILIPVQLDRHAQSGGFRLVYTGDDLQGNLTLELKLREQGLSLPDLPASEDLLPSSYFREVEEALRSRIMAAPSAAEADDWFATETPTSARETWSIDAGISFLGFFSFSKFLMYRDLLPVSWPENVTPYGHPLLTPLLAGQVSEERLEELESLDNATTGPETWHVLDADSSQAEAIHHVLQGKHMVLQGPPGTGKSQTITNMIAGLIAQGKTVLFVAEKEAALSVVEERLKKVGLGHATLALHSKDAKKTALRDSLFQAMQQRRLNTPSQGEDAHLSELVTLLHALPQDLNTPIGRGSVTPFAAMGRLLELQDHLPAVGQLLGEPGSAFGTLAWDDAQWAAARRLSQELGDWIAQRGLPHNLTLWGSPKQTALPQDMTRLETALTHLETQVLALKSALDQNPTWDIPSVTQISELQEQTAELSELLGAPDLQGLAVSEHNWSEAPKRLTAERARHTQFLQLEQALVGTLELGHGPYPSVPASFRQSLTSLRTVIDTAQQLLSLEKTLLGEVHVEALDADVTETLVLLTSSGSSLFSFFNGQVRQARKRVQGWLLKEQKDVRQMLRILSSIEQYQELRKDQQKMASQSPLPLGTLKQVPWQLVGQHVTWLDSNLPASGPFPAPELRTFSLAWAALLHVLGGTGQVSTTKLDALLSAERALQPDRLLKTLCGPHLQGMDTSWDDLASKVQWMAQWQSQPRKSWAKNLLLQFAQKPSLQTTLQAHLAELRRYPNVQDALKDVQTLVELPEFGQGPLPKLIGRVQQLKQDRQAISAVVSWNNLVPRLEKAGLSALLQLIHKLPREEAAQRLPLVAELFWYTELLESAFAQRSALATFDRQQQETRRRQFRQLDLDRLQFNRLRVQQAYLQRLPQASSVGQLGILQREFAKKKRLMPIRDLMKVAGKAVQAIKPVFMMSPLSLANFIPLGSLNFDVVIFDEASQVKPSDALGSLLRGQQAVVVGDLKQLGPTNFFGKASGQDEEDTEDDTAGLESLLALFEAQYAGYRHSLTWHYRSQHESLIQTSNEAFYGGALVTFPSSQGQSADLGLKYHHLDPAQAYFEGGGKSVNRGEADAVVHAVIQHARQRPGESLAVVTFSAAQQKLIADKIDVAVAALDDHTRQFFSETAHDKFVVKNLENVQGDERDVIMISVGYGYAPDERSQGMKFYRRFGPLGTADGWRRLNVLITRARKRIEVFANFQPEDITGLNDTEVHRGMRAFKQFLERCLDRSGGQGPTEGEGPSGLPRQVAQTLSAAGYTVQAQVGTSASRIELALLHPQQSGRYILGIELDGPQYQQARSVRDRDRLREDVLGVFGWKIYRIWSVDWFRDPQQARQDLLARAQQAVREADLPPPLPEISAREEAITLPGNPEAQEENAPELDQPDWSAGVQGEPYQEATCQLYPQGDFSKLGSSELQAAIVDIVQQEGPIHKELLARRLMKAAGITRKGSRVQAAIDLALSFAAQSRVDLQGPFVQLKGVVEARPRTRANRPIGEQSLEYVSDLELLWTIHDVVGRAVGITQQELPSGCLDLLGLKRVSSDVRGRIDTLVDMGIEVGLLARQDDTLVLQQSFHA